MANTGRASSPTPQAFHNNNIPALDSLVQQFETAGVVAVDIEPWSKNFREPAEIAFSFLPPASDHRIQPPATMKAFLAEDRVRTHTIRLSGREQSKREYPRFGDIRTVGVNEVEGEIGEILDSFTKIGDERYSSSPAQAISPLSNTRRLILTGWDLSMEFGVLSKLYPSTLRYFSAWTDLQQQVKAVSTTANPTYEIRMSDFLVALGMGGDYISVNSKAHRSGNDTARMIAILLHLINWPRVGSPLTVIRSENKKWYPRMARNIYRYDDRVFQARPWPPEDYPFLAELSLPSALIQVPALTLLAHFAEYEPTAVGLAMKPEERSCGWLALPSPTMLQRFVREVKGSQFGVRGDAWEVSAHVDPGFENFTDEEWEEYRRKREAKKSAEKEVLVENKRQARKERGDLVTGIGNISLLNDDDGEKGAMLEVNEGETHGILGALEWT